MRERAHSVPLLTPVRCWRTHFYMTHEELREVVLHKMFANEEERQRFLARWREIRPEADPDELLADLADGLILSALSRVPPAGTA